MELVDMPGEGDTLVLLGGMEDDAAAGKLCGADGIVGERHVRAVCAVGDVPVEERAEKTRGAILQRHKREKKLMREQLESLRKER